MEDVEVHRGDDGHDEMKKHVGDVGEQVEEVVLCGDGQEVEDVEDGPR